MKELGKTKALIIRSVKLFFFSLLFLRVLGALNVNKLSSLTIHRDASVWRTGRLTPVTLMMMTTMRMMMMMMMTTLHDDDDDDDADDHDDDDDDNEDDNEDVLNKLFNKWPRRLLLVSTITLVLCPSLTGIFAMTHNLQRRK